MDDSDSRVERRVSVVSSYNTLFTRVLLDACLFSWDGILLRILKSDKGSTRSFLRFVSFSLFRESLRSWMLLFKLRCFLSCFSLFKVSPVLRLCELDREWNMFWSFGLDSSAWLFALWISSFTNGTSVQFP